jgi:hypothetical protein
MWVELLAFPLGLVLYLSVSFFTHYFDLRWLLKLPLGS